MLNALARRITLNAALLLDAAGCFALASVLLLSTTVWGWSDLPAGWRIPVVVAMFLFSVVLVAAARFRTRPLVALAALGNIAWVAAGAIALLVTETLLGGFLIGVVMLLDFAMAWIQARALTDPDMTPLAIR